MKQLLTACIYTTLLSSVFAGCASPPEGDFPSLAKRPFEDQPVTAPPAAPTPAPQQLPPALAGDMAALEARVTKAAAAFNARLPAARSRANSARGAAPDGESWLAAHAQLSRLDKTRADGVAALAEIDRLVTAQLETQLSNGGPPYSQLMIPRQRRMADIIDRQSAIIDSLSQIIGL